MVISSIRRQPLPQHQLALAPCPTPVASMLGCLGACTLTGLVADLHAGGTTSSGTQDAVIGKVTTHGADRTILHVAPPPRGDLLLRLHAILLTKHSRSSITAWMIRPPVNSGLAKFEVSPD